MLKCEISLEVSHFLFNFAPRNQITIKVWQQKKLFKH